MRLILINNAPLKLNHYDWFGDIPSDWVSKKLKYIFEEKKSTKNPLLNSGAISFGEVIYKNDEKITASTKNSYQEVLDGEFLINPLNLNFDLKSLRIALSKIDVVVSQGYIVLKINKEFCPDYYKYLFRKFDVEYMKSLGQGVRQTISFNDIKNEYLIIPPLSEQKIISKFLNAKTKKIDSLVERIQKRIELLKEYKTALINQYVTQGLNQNVEKKDSKVNWIGEIPKHWNLHRNKKFFKQVKNLVGNNWRQYTLLSLGRPGVTIRDIEGGKGKFPESFETYQEVKKGQFVFCLFDMDETPRTIGLSEEEGMITGAYTVFECSKNVCPDYIFFYYLIIDEFKGLAPHYSGLRKTIRPTKFLSLNIYLPPLDEQFEIANFIKAKTLQINKLISLEEKRINFLKEYRQSLISSIVTGKIRITEDMM